MQIKPKPNEYETNLTNLIKDIRDTFYRRPAGDPSDDDVQILDSHAVRQIRRNAGKCRYSGYQRV